MDVGPDVNSDVHSSFDIVLAIGVWRSQICKSGRSSLVRVVGGKRRFHEVVHDMSASVGIGASSRHRGRVACFFGESVAVLTWDGKWFPVSLHGGRAAPYCLCHGFEVHLWFSNDFLWGSCRFVHFSFSARLLVRFLFCLEALWFQVAREEDVPSPCLFRWRSLRRLLRWSSRRCPRRSPSMSVAHVRYTEQRAEYNVCACARCVSGFVVNVLRVFFVLKCGALTDFSIVSHHFCLLGRPRRGRCRIPADGASCATPSTMPTLLGWASSRIAYRRAGVPRQDCVQCIFSWSLSRFSSGATRRIWHAFPLATNTRVSSSCLRWLRELGVCASALWHFTFLLVSMALPCSLWATVSIALEAATFGRCDRDLHHDVENRCGLESGSCVGAYFCHGINRFHCRFDALQDSHHLQDQKHQKHQKPPRCAARGHDVAAEARTPDNGKVCLCTRWSRSRLVQLQEKHNCCRGANFL